MRQGVRPRLASPLAIAGVAAAVIAGLGAGLAGQAPSAAIDEARAAWRYRRPVTLPDGVGADGRFVAIAIPSEVAGHSQPGLEDLRLVAADGREVPYVLDVDLPRTTERRRSGQLVESQHERRRASVWTVDFGAAAPLDRLELDVAGSDFSKRLEIEASLDGTQWTRITDAWIFDRPWRGRRVHDTAIDLASPVTARIVRITADDFRSTPLPVTGATAVLATHLGGRRWTRDATLVRLDTPPGQPSRYRVEASPGAPVERITIGTDDVAFHRQIRVLAASPRGAEEPVSATGTLYRLRLDDADLDAEQLDVDLTKPVALPLIVEIDDGDSPPLARPRATLSGIERRALVPVTAGGLTLYYGNAATRRPVYDLEALRTRLALVDGYPPAALGAEATNPRFAPLAPMSFLAARGATADTPKWKVARALTIAGRDDVYTLTLAPTDLASLRSDFGDVRIVDEERRQVPYVLEPRAAAARVALGSQGAAPRDGAPRTSAWQLTVPAVAGLTGDASVPLGSIELSFRDAFYSRPATLLVPDARAPHGQRVLQQVTLRASRRASGPALPQVLDLGDLRTSALGLEVSDGDNAPLTLTRAEAIVWVPRLTFKAAAGRYRVLFGNPDAAAPTYDLADLRQDVLAYSAIPVEPSALQAPAPNADYARGARDVVAGLEGGPLLWIVTGVSIVALLWLTRTILKSPPSPPSS